MKIEDFCEVLRSKTGEKKVLAYKINNLVLFEQYFKECNYKPAILAEKLNIHYQSCRKLLMDAGLWKYVSTKNGKGSGINRRRFKQGTKDGYLYSKDPNSLNFQNGRARRKLEHIEVMENHLGRKLKSNEIVHHIDCNKLNNDISNLHLCTRNEHGLLHKNLEQQAAILFKRGLIKFHPDHGYFINDELEFDLEAK